MRCIERCVENGLVLILEDGVAWHFMGELEKQFYQLILGFLDIQVNFSLRPGWFFETAPEIGKNFFLNYLDQDTFNFFETKCNVKIKHKLIRPIGPYVLPCQTLCLFEIGERNETVR